MSVLLLDFEYFIQENAWPLSKSLDFHSWCPCRESKLMLRIQTLGTKSAIITRGERVEKCRYLLLKRIWYSILHFYGQF